MHTLTLDRASLQRPAPQVGLAGFAVVTALKQRVCTRLFETRSMRANVWSLCLAISLLAFGALAERSPYDVRIHRWELTLGVALVSLFLITNAMRSLRPARREEGFAALGALGGGVIGIALVAAELLVGPPQRVDAAPGQIYHPPHSSRVGIAFPLVDAKSLARLSPDSVAVVVGNVSTPLLVGGMLRTHSYMFNAVRWPATYVQAWSPAHIGQTVTQPNGVAFVSPVLLFSDVDTDSLPIDSFNVPALHREVHVKYYPGLPARGIDVPFIQLQISEENGGPLFSGVTVSGRQVKAAGVVLVLTLGSYPLVTMAPIPDEFMLIAGGCMVAAGVLGFVVIVLRNALARGTT
jgi:hypothetical protein